MAAPTTSGTANFKLDILQICEEAFERAGGEMRTGYDLRSARRSLELLALEWMNRGLNLWTVTEASIDLVDGTKTYSLADDCIDVLDAVIRTNTNLATQTDTALTRLSVSTYAQTSSKNTNAQPTSMYVNRQNRPTVTLYPEPDDSTQDFVYWYVRRIEDLGDNTNNNDMPERAIPALVSGLAFFIALKRPEFETRIPTLKSHYEEQYELMAQEDRTKTSLLFSPLQDSIEVNLT
jgi:hypothetical protein|tara:strand:+ start:1252 stop:1956 length:705 start_codon:yes stop_codon:yes gene_type:complete